MRAYDAVFFDVDGTLIDSAPGILHTLRLVFAHFHTEIQGVDLMRYVGPPLRRTFAEYYADPLTVENAVALYRASYKEVGSHMCTLYPGVECMLEQLQAEGVALYTATSKPVQVARPILQELGIAGRFEEIGGASMGTARDTKTAVVRALAQKPQLRGKRILMVGDRNDDMQGAADCGLDAAAVLYGYGSMAELIPYHPVLLAKDCPQLVNFILDGEKNEL